MSETSRGAGQGCGEAAKIEAAARALCVVRGLNPDCVFWHEPWDRDDRNEKKPWPDDVIMSNGKPGHWGWRHFIRDVKAVMAALAAAPSSTAAGRTG